MDFVVAPILILVAALYLAALVYVFVQVWRSDELSDLERWVWSGAIVCFPFVSMLVWFAAGAHPFGIRLTRDLR